MYPADQNRSISNITGRTKEGVLRFALMIEAQQGLSYLDQLAIVRRAEAAGFESFFRSDHYASFPGASDGPTTDAWTVLAGLARETERIGLGVLVSPVTFRHPGAFVKVVTTVDHMSGGRIEVGIGAGWNADEHRQLGLAFPEIEIRADLMEDQLAILHGLWTEGDGWSYEGRQTSVDRGFLRPKPVDVPASATVLDAVERADPALAEGVRSGDLAVMDSRGLPIEAGAPLHGGAILRLVAVRRREN